MYILEGSAERERKGDSIYLQEGRDVIQRDFGLPIYMNSSQKGTADVYRNRHNQNLQDAVDYYYRALRLANPDSTVDAGDAIYVERPRCVR